MPFYDVYGQRKAMDVTEETFGHLKPENKPYNGWLMVSHSTYGDITVLDWNFQDLVASPWQFGHFETGIEKWMNETYPDLKDFEAGIYIFIGTYTPPDLKGRWLMYRFTDIIERIGGW